MDRDKAYHYASGYATGRADANDIHGDKKCCCQHCPWSGNHGWPPFVIPHGIPEFAQSYAALHEAFERNGGGTPPTIGQSFAIWQETAGQRAGVLPELKLSKACRAGRPDLCDGVAMLLPYGSSSVAATVPCEHPRHKTEVPSVVG